MVNGKTNRTLTASSGLASFSITAGYARLRHLSCVAASPGTTFDFTVYSTDDVELYSVEGATGETVEQTDIPLYGKTTFSIDNASADEAFEVNVMTQDQV